MSRSFRVSGAIAVAVIVGGILAACAPATDPSPSVSPSATRSQSPEPVPTASQPAVAFGGDCAAVLDADALTAAMGEQMNSWDPVWEDGAPAKLGGVRCAWTSEQYLSVSAAAWVYPLDVLDADWVVGDGANSCDADTHSCIASAVFGDAWVGIRLSSDRAESLIENARPLVDEIGARLAGEPAPVADARAAWWNAAPTCADLAAALETQGIGLTVQGDYPAAAPAFAGGPLERGCAATATVDGVTFQTHVVLRAGAADGVAAVLALNPGAAVDGGGRTFAVTIEQYPFDGGSGLMLGDDGANLVELSLFNGEPTAQDPVLLAAILDALAP